MANLVCRSCSLFSAICDVMCVQRGQHLGARGEPGLPGPHRRVHAETEGEGGEEERGKEKIIRGGPKRLGGAREQEEKGGGGGRPGCGRCEEPLLSVCV